MPKFKKGDPVRPSHSALPRSISGMYVEAYRDGKYAMRYTYYHTERPLIGGLIWGDDDLESLYTPFEQFVREVLRKNDHVD